MYIAHTVFEMEIVSVVNLFILIVILGVVLAVYREKLTLRTIQNNFDSLEKFIDRTERGLREDVTEMREEMYSNARQTREESTGAIISVGDNLHKRVHEMSNLLQGNIEVIANQVHISDQAFENKLQHLTNSLQENHLRLIEQNGTHSKELGTRVSDDAKNLREELISTLNGFSTSQTQTYGELRNNVEIKFTEFTESLKRLVDCNQKDLIGIQDEMRKNVIQIQNENLKKLDYIGDSMLRSNREQRQELTDSVQALSTSVQKSMGEISAILKTPIDSVCNQVNSLTSAIEQRMEGFRENMNTRLQSIQEDNSNKLEQMRSTVEEKLQGTLDKRLGESFLLVSERLEQVHRGLGAMQALAVGVGDLKRTLTNVKTRGGWGEIQLGNLLEQMLAPDQYIKGAKTKDGSNETVEFAIRIPVHAENEDEWILLPVDSKFPMEDYDRLTFAQEQGDKEQVDEAARAMAGHIKTCAKDIANKYINPPITTDYAILFLPTEGLFAEAVRFPGLIEKIQTQYRVTVAGPTTFAALLNSLQMGFRAVAIQRHTNEVWKLLGSVQKDFGKFGDLLISIKKKLDGATSSVEEAMKRTKILGKRLNKVESLPAPVRGDDKLQPSLESINDEASEEIVSG